MFDKSADNVREQVEQTKRNRKILYHFAIFAIINKILLTIVEY